MQSIQLSNLADLKAHEHAAIQVYLQESDAERERSNKKLHTRREKYKKKKKRQNDMPNILSKLKNQ